MSSIVVCFLFCLTSNTKYKLTCPSNSRKADAKKQLTSVTHHLSSQVRVKVTVCWLVIS